MKTAVYPGSFDPVTFGHLDIIERAAKMFDVLNVTVMINQAKTPLFFTEERVNILREATAHLDNVIVDSYHGLLIDYCRENGIHIAIRGLRAITDFEYELQIAQTNRLLSKGELDTLFLTTDLKYSYLSSSTVREVASYGGDVRSYVPAPVAEAIIRKNRGEEI